MTNRLADRIVACGVGESIPNRSFRGERSPLEYYRIDGTLMDAEQFESDWRVAGAMLEKVSETSAELLREVLDELVCGREIGYGFGPTQINKACCEALSDV